MTAVAAELSRLPRWFVRRQRSYRLLGDRLSCR